MYEAHFGLAELPFPATQDPRAYVDTAPHRAAVLALLAGFERGDDFMLLTGEFGVGKTTVARRMLAQLDRARHRVVELTSMRVEGDEFFDRIAEAVEPHAADTGHGQRALSRLLEGLGAAGQDAFVLVDEAQRLDIDGLDRLRELAAARIEGRGVLHVCLMGRSAPPGLEVLRRLGRPLNVGATVDVGPLDAAGTRDYLLARLGRVGWTGRPSFDQGALAEIHARCGGIPARINRLCGHILLHLYMLRRDDVDAEVVRAVDNLLQSELDGEPSTLELPPFVASMPTTQTGALPGARNLPQRRRPGGAPATSAGFGAAGWKRWRRRWIPGAALAVLLSSGGVGWYATSRHSISRAEEARVAAAWAMATRAPAPVPPSAAATSAVPTLPTVAAVPPAPVALPAPVAMDTTEATETPGSARATQTVAALAPQRLPDEAREERRRIRREQAQALRPAGSTTPAMPATPAACTLEGETLGLCSGPRMSRPARDAARAPAGDSTRAGAPADPPAGPPADPLRPSCEPTRAALGLCPDRATTASPHVAAP